MNEPMLPITVDQLLDVIRKLLEAFKKVLAWLGILVLPDEDDDFPGNTNSSSVASE